MTCSKSSGEERERARVRFVDEKESAWEGDRAETERECGNTSGHERETNERGSEGRRSKVREGDLRYTVKRTE